MTNDATPHVGGDAGAGGQTIFPFALQGNVLVDLDAVLPVFFELLPILSSRGRFPGVGHVLLLVNRVGSQVKVHGSAKMLPKRGARRERD